MDTHHAGPRAKLGYGSVVTVVIASAVFGTTAEGTVLVTQTEGATPTTPLMLRISGQIKTAFNGLGAAMTLQQTDLDGTNATNIAVISDFSSNKFSTTIFLTADKKFNLIFAKNTTGGAATFADGVTNTDTSLVSATAAFVAGDVGKTVTGAGIPAGTTISSRTNGTTVVLSQATTATATGVSFTIVGRTPGTAGEGYYGLELAGKGQYPQHA